MTTRDLEQYRAAYLADYGFESTMVRFRHELLIERIAVHGARTVLEIGCGAESLYRRFLQEGGVATQWVCVEPITSFCEQAMALSLPGLAVLQGEAEERVEAVRELMPGGPDIILCSSLLHEVQAPERLMRALVAVMGATSVVHVNVPNATSLHRRLAVEMGLIARVDAPSERNRQLLQARVYESESLAAAMTAAGLVVGASGGYMVKPFHHNAMESVAPLVGEEVLRGLYALGKKMPQIASEIYSEGRLS